MQYRDDDMTAGEIKDQLEWEEIGSMSRFEIVEEIRDILYGSFLDEYERIMELLCHVEKNNKDIEELEMLLDRENVNEMNRLETCLEVLRTK